MPSLTTIGLLIFIFSFLGGLAYWMVILRPYLQKRNITQITAPNWGLSALSDWQMCGDHAQEHRDPESRRIARGFTICLLAQIAGILILVVAVAAGRA